MSVNGIFRHVCCEMNGVFFVIFNLFPKIHRRALRNITIDLLY